MQPQRQKVCSEKKYLYNLYAHVLPVVHAESAYFIIMIYENNSIKMNSRKVCYEKFTPFKMAQSSNGYAMVTALLLAKFDLNLCFLFTTVLFLLLVFCIYLLLLFYLLL